MMRSIAALLCMSSFLAACVGDGSEGGPRTTPSLAATDSPCQADLDASRELQIDMPKPGAFYTRHVPVEGWTDANPGDPVEVRVTGGGGGLLGSSTLEVGGETLNGRHRIEGIMVLQVLPERLAACVAIGAAGRFVFVPVEVGGANP